MKFRLTMLVLMLVLVLSLCACHAVEKPVAGADPSSGASQEATYAAPLDGVAVRSSATVCYRTPFDELRSDAE